MRKQEMYRLIDTFDDFVEYWTLTCSKTIEQKLQLWENSYMIKYPELLEKQIQSYEELGLDWREIAKKKVLSKLGKYFSLMQKARENLIQVCSPTYERAIQALGLNFYTIFVIYVGIGCGAGWATQYKGHPACLFGLEKIAELNWCSQERLRGLVAHEMGHLVHMKWREEFENFETEEKDPLFLLYSEGFAKRCEYFILGKEVWNEAEDEDWILWCLEHRGWLAKEYLFRIDKKISVNDFFGDWLSIQGKRQTGYFLGHEFIRWLEENHNIREIATFPFEKIKEHVRQYLCYIAADFT
jgi:hypothetical protein